MNAYLLIVYIFTHIIINVIELSAKYFATIINVDIFVMELCDY